MNLLGYDALAIGNHEFDAGPAALGRLAALARFPWLSANLDEAESGRPPGFVRAAVEKEVAGVRVALVGLTAEDTQRISLPPLTAGFRFRPALDAARAEVAVARERGAEVVVIVSHCGAESDRAIAAAVPGIDAIVGGHSHRALDPPHVDPRTGTIVAATDGRGTALGRLRLVYDRERRAVVERAGEVIECRSADWPPHEPTERLIAAYAVTINAIMDVPLGVAEEDLIRVPGFASSELGSWVADVMREAVGADVALTNKTGLRADIPKGAIRLREVYQVSPFGNTCVTLRLSGRELRQAIEFSLSDPALALEVSGLTVRYDLERPRGDRAVAIWVGGEPLDLDRAYTVVTNSFLASGGDGHRTLAGGRDRRDTGLDVMRLHAEDVKRRGRVRLAIPSRVAPAEPPLPAEPAGRPR